MLHIFLLSLSLFASLLIVIFLTFFHHYCVAKIKKSERRIISPKQKKNRRRRRLNMMMKNNNNNTMWNSRRNKQPKWVRLERMRGTWKKFHFMNVFYRICADSTDFIYIYLSINRLFWHKNIDRNWETLSRGFRLRHNFCWYFFIMFLLFFTLSFVCLFMNQYFIVYTSSQSILQFCIIIIITDAVFLFYSFAL